MMINTGVASLGYQNFSVHAAVCSSCCWMEDVFVRLKTVIFLSSYFSPSFFPFSFFLHTFLLPSFLFLFYFTSVLFCTFKGIFLSDTFPLTFLILRSAPLSPLFPSILKSVSFFFFSPSFSPSPPFFRPSSAPLVYTKFAFQLGGKGIFKAGPLNFLLTSANFPIFFHG